MYELFQPSSGHFFSKTELENMLNISMTFHCYQSLARSIPEDLRWNKKRKKILGLSNIPLEINLVFNSKNFAKHAYNVFFNPSG